jgi:hypothetical protein
MRRTIGAAALLAASWTGTATAYELNWFYCFAPDPETGTVHVSERLPVGPVAERAGYGREFVEHLQDRRLLGPDMQGYCFMAETEAEIERAQRDLGTDCRVCGGASRFVRIAWPRPGTAVAGSTGASVNGGTAPAGGGTPGAGGGATQAGDATSNSGPTGTGAATPPAGTPPPAPLPSEIAVPLSALVNLPLDPGWKGWLQAQSPGSRPTRRT